MSDRPYCYLALPGYAGQHASITAVQLASRDLTIRLGEQQASLLALNFNTLWCRALNLRRKRRVDYFAMLHADIEPEEGWLDALVGELEAHSADVFSAVVPIKEDRGLT